MEYNRYCDTFGKTHETSKFALFPTVFDKQVAVKLTITTELPYLHKNNTQIVEFSVVSPESAKNIKPVYTALFHMLPEGDLDVTTYMNEFLKTNKPHQQNNTFWFPTPK